MKAGCGPCLQAAANTERFGGSVAKLRQAVVDGKLSSQEFYQSILNNSAELDAKASKAVLTLAGAFEAVASQLTVYIGSASSANGVTGALSAGIAALGNNLDVIIPALAVIAVAMGGTVGGGSIRSAARHCGPWRICFYCHHLLAGTAFAGGAAGKGASTLHCAQTLSGLLSLPYPH